MTDDLIINPVDDGEADEGGNILISSRYQDAVHATMGTDYQLRF